MSPSDVRNSLLLQFGNGLELPFSLMAALVCTAFLVRYWEDRDGRLLVGSLASLFLFNALSRVIILVGLNQINFGFRPDTSLYYFCLPTIRFGVAASIYCVGAAICWPLGWGRHWAAFGVVAAIVSAAFVIAGH